MRDFLVFWVVIFLPQELAENLAAVPVNQMLFISCYGSRHSVENQTISDTHRSKLWVLVLKRDKLWCVRWSLQTPAFIIVGEMWRKRSQKSIQKGLIKQPNESSERKTLSPVLVRLEITRVAHLYVLIEVIYFDLIKVNNVTASRLHLMFIARQPKTWKKNMAPPELPISCLVVCQGGKCAF